MAIVHAHDLEVEVGQEAYEMNLTSDLTLKNMLRN
jgi:hypothetical protein